MEVDVKNAVVGTVIEFTIGSEQQVFDLKLVSAGTWCCYYHDRHEDEDSGRVWYESDIIRQLRRGDWVARAVHSPVVMKEKTQAYKVSHTAQRLKALAKLGVTTTFRPDGWVIFSSDWCRLEVSPESEFPEGLKKAEAVFGKS